MTRRAPGVYGSVRVHHVPVFAYRALHRLVVLALPLILLLAPFSRVWSKVPADPKEQKHVLILMQEDPSWPVYRLLDENIRSTLHNALPGSLLIFGEHLDETHFPDPEIQRAEVEGIKKKYTGTRLDLIIAIGEVPANLFPGVPVVFLSANPRRKPPTLPIASTTVANVWVELDAEKTLEVARRLQPQAHRLIIVTDASSSEDGVLGRLRHKLPAIAGDMQQTYLTSGALPDICKEVSALGPDAIVLFIALTHDENGRPLISAETIPKVAAASGAPVYTMFDTHFGTGAVGGYVSSFAEIGKAGGQLALRILAGEAPQDVVANNLYLFDWRQLRRWNISESALPPGSVVLFRQTSVWEAYKWYFLGAALLCALQAILILGLLWQRSKKRDYQQSLVTQMAFEKMLSDLSTTFINLPEDQVSTTIQKSLGQIAKFLNLDRVTLFEYTQSKSELSVSYSWQAADVSRVPTILKFDKLEWLTTSFQSGGAIIVSDLSALPAEAFAEREYFRKLGTHSFAAFPLRAGDESLGCISFASTTRRVAWTDDLVEQLKLVAEIFSNALARTRAQEARLRHAAIVESSDDAIISEDLHGIVLSWNVGAQQMFQYQPEEIVGHSIELLIPPDQRDEDKRILDAIRRGVHIEHYETLRVTKNQKQIDVSLTISPVRDSAGVIIGAAKIARNISDRKRAEQILKVSQESLHTLSGRLIRAQEEERARIARELHDDFSQRLAILGIGLGQLWRKLPESDEEERAKVLEMLKSTKEICSDIHSLSHQLHSSKLEHVGLRPALSGLCKEIAARHNIDIHFRDFGIPREIPKDTALCLFRIAQECLSNIIKHSQAATAKVELAANGETINLRISDSGIGFDLAARNPNSGIGLISMSERLRLVGGKLTVDSRPRSGTTIFAEVPLAVSVREASKIAVAGG
jgi:PAS domain S-box-containing protein